MSKLTKENTKDGEESYFLRCACYGHLLNVAVFEEDLKNPRGILYLSTYSADSRYLWLNRLREVWKLFRSGVGGGNEMVLYPDEALELGQKIVELAKKMKGEESG